MKNLLYKFKRFAGRDWGIELQLLAEKFSCNIQAHRPEKYHQLNIRTARRLEKIGAL
jgi:hypothetical protein